MCTGKNWQIWEQKWKGIERIQKFEGLEKLTGSEFHTVKVMTKKGFEQKWPSMFSQVNRGKSGLMQVRLRMLTSHETYWKWPYNDPK